MALKQLPALTAATAVEDDDVLLLRKAFSNTDEKLTLQVLRDTGGFVVPDDLGTAAALDTGIEPGELPKNSDLSEGAFLDAPNNNDLSVDPADLALRSVVADALDGVVVLGNNQTTQDFSGNRVTGTSYQNTSGRLILVSMAIAGGVSRELQVSDDNATWMDVGVISSVAASTASWAIQDGEYYRISDSGGTVLAWAEMRT